MSDHDEFQVDRKRLTKSPMPVGARILGDIPARFRARYPEAAAIAERLNCRIHYSGGVWFAIPGHLQLTGYKFGSDGRSLTDEQKQDMPRRQLARALEARDESTGLSLRQRAMRVFETIRDAPPRYRMITECRMPCLDEGGYWEPAHKVHAMWIVLAGEGLKLDTKERETREQCFAEMERLIGELSDDKAGTPE